MYIKVCAHKMNSPTMVGRFFFFPREFPTTKGREKDNKKRNTGELCN